MSPHRLLLPLALLLAAAPAAAKDELPRFGDVTFGAGGAFTTTPVEPGSPDVLLSPALVLDVNLLTPIFVTAGVHGGFDVTGPRLGWDATLGGVIGGGMSLHGDGRTSGDVFLGLPIPLNDDGVYLQLFARAGPYLDDPREGWASAGLMVKYSSWWDRAADPPKKKAPKKRGGVRKPTKKPSPDEDDGYEPAPGPYRPPKKSPGPRPLPKPKKRV